MNQPALLDWLPTSSTSILDAAIAYARHGFRPLPIYGLRDGRCACGAAEGECKPGKHPSINAWQKRPSSNEDETRDMFHRAKKPSNIGLLMGDQGDGIYLIAFDIDGESGRARYEEIASRLGPLPATLAARSGRPDGGEHRIVKLAPGQDPERINNRAKLGLDWRAKGGQIVVCPSLHISGNRYSWANDLPIATLPDAWFNEIAKPVEVPRPSALPKNVYRFGDAYVSKVIENAAQEISQGKPGERNHRLAAKTRTVLEYCAGHGVAWETPIERLRQAGRACGLSPREVDETIRKAVRDVERSGKTRQAPPPKPRSSSSEETSDAWDEEEPSSALLEVWRQNLTTDRGRYEDCLANVITVLAQHPAWEDVLQYDEFREAIVFTREPPCREQDRPRNRPQGNVWTEADDTRTRAWIRQHLGFEPSKSHVVDAVAAVSERASVHPVRAYLAGLQWDGVERLPTMLANYFGASPNAYTAGIGTLWMISAVARVMVPGAQVDYMLGLEGPQGLGKSSGLRALCPSAGWYSDTGVVIGQKDSYISLHGKWIFCFDELDSIRGSDITKTKSFLTSRSDNFRPPWGRRNRDYLRQVIFAYTTNEEGYLRDRTGNRRWWPFFCTFVDAEAIARDRDQLWAEARARYERGDRWWPDSELTALCRDEQEERTLDDTWTQLVDEWIRSDRGQKVIRDNGGLFTHDVLLSAIGLPAKEISRGHEMRVAEALRELGWVASKRPGSTGNRLRLYTRESGVGAANDMGDAQGATL